MVKGDKGKFAKRGGRGSGSSRFYATSAEEIELRNNRIADFDANRMKRRSEEDGDDVEDDNENEEQNNEAPTGQEEHQQEPIIHNSDTVDTKMQHLALLDEYDNEGGNDDYPSEEPIRTMTRKEREMADKEKAAAEYRRKHELGLTDEYKRDMAKLEEVRKRRELAAQRALEEKEIKDSAEKEARERAHKKGILEDDEDEDEEMEKNDKSDEKEEKKKSSNKKSTSTIPKLDKITIKKMKPAQLKEALKARNLEIQGNAKELTDRLLEYELAR